MYSFLKDIAHSGSHSSTHSSTSTPPFHLDAHRDYQPYPPYYQPAYSPPCQFLTQLSGHVGHLVMNPERYYQEFNEEISRVAGITRVVVDTLRCTLFIPSPTVYLGLAAAEARCEHMITECYFAIPIIKLFYLFGQRPGRMDDTYNHIPKTSSLPRIQIFLAATFQQLFQLIYLFRR